jgi:hypothetical protein
MRLALALALTGLLVTATPAAAEPETRVTQSSSQIRVRSLDTQNPQEIGAENLITVQEAADGSVRILEGRAGVPLVAEAPCFIVATQEANCPADPAGKRVLVITTGKRRDSIEVDLPATPARISDIFVAGGPDGDFIIGSAGPDTLAGDYGKGIPGTSPPDPLVPEGGDAIWGAGGSDDISGEGGPDYLNGGFSNATLDPAGNVLDGGDEHDFFDAGRTPGPDRFVGGSGNDEPTDFATVLGGNPLINGAQASVAGGDTVSYQTRTYDAAGSAGVTADLDGNADDGAAGEADEIETDVEALTGTLRDDTLTGSAQPNRLTAGLGVDKLSGGAGADDLRLKDGVRDRCFSKGAGDFVDADLADPDPDECPPFGISVFMPPLFTFNSQPVDETIPYVVLGPRLRVAGGRLVATVRCPRGARRGCRGRLGVARARRRAAALARARYRVRRGRTARVVLRPSPRELARLRADRRARLTAVARGTSKIGPTSTTVVRRLSPR